MLKRRIIAVLPVRSGIVVQSIAFGRYLPVGTIDVSIEFLSRWGIDEIVLLDMDATPQKRRPAFDVVTRASRRAFVPLTIGGGISSLEDIRMLIHAGADKIAINHAALTNPAFVSEAAAVFGSQCVVVSIDVRRNAAGVREVFGDRGRVATGRSPADVAREMEKHGAGEILLNSIDRDGMKSGFDTALITDVVSAVHIPVIACGGVGNAEDFRAGIAAGASAVAAGNYFHFSEHSVIIVKSHLARAGIDVRLDTRATYDGCTLEGVTGRIAKRESAYLHKLRFEYQKDEVI